MELMVGTGLYEPMVGYILEFGHGLAGKVGQSGEVMAVNHYQSWEGRHDDSAWNDVQSIIGVPLKFKDAVIGVITLLHTEEGRKFSSGDIEILNRFAALAAIALENAKLYKEVRHLNDGLEERIKERTTVLNETIEELSFAKEAAEAEAAEAAEAPAEEAPAEEAPAEEAAAE